MAHQSPHQDTFACSLHVCDVAAIVCIGAQAAVGLTLQQQERIREAAARRHMWICYLVNERQATGDDFQVLASVQKKSLLQSALYVSVSSSYD